MESERETGRGTERGETGEREGGAARQNRAHQRAQPRGRPGRHTDRADRSPPQPPGSVRDPLPGKARARPGASHDSQGEPTHGGLPVGRPGPGTTGRGPRGPRARCLSPGSLGSPSAPRTRARAPLGPRETPRPLALPGAPGSRRRAGSPGSFPDRLVRSIVPRISSRPPESVCDPQSRCVISRRANDWNSRRANDWNGMIWNESWSDFQARSAIPRPSGHTGCDTAQPDRPRGPRPSAPRRPSRPRRPARGAARGWPRGTLGGEGGRLPREAAADERHALPLLTASVHRCTEADAPSSTRRPSTSSACLGDNAQPPGRPPAVPFRARARAQAPVAPARPHPAPSARTSHRAG